MQEFISKQIPMCDFNPTKVNGQLQLHEAVKQAEQSFFNCKTCHAIRCHDCVASTLIFILPNFLPYLAQFKVQFMNFCKDHFKKILLYSFISLVLFILIIV
jgi:hypothetical protein